MECATAWNGSRPSIYRFLLEASAEDRSNLRLPDDDTASGAKSARWVAGGQDGVLLKHDYDMNCVAGEETAIFADAFVSAVRDPIEPHLVPLYRLLVDDRAVTLVAPLLSSLSEHDIEMASGLSGLACWLATEAPDRQPVKFALALLGRFGNTQDISVIMCIGQHDEFTLYAADAIMDLMTEPDPWLWSLAQQPTSGVESIPWTG